MKGYKNIKVPQLYPSVPNGKIEQKSLRLLRGVRLFITPKAQPGRDSWVLTLEFQPPSSADDYQVELAECLERSFIPKTYMIPAHVSMNEDELTLAFVAIILKELIKVTLEYDEDADEVTVSIQMFGREFSGRGRLRKMIAVLDISA